MVPVVLGTREIAAAHPRPGDRTLLFAERNAWKEIHNMVFSGTPLKEAMEKQKNNLLFWNREVCQRAWALKGGKGHAYEKPVIKSWDQAGPEREERGPPPEREAEGEDTHQRERRQRRHMATTLGNQGLPGEALLQRLPPQEELPRPMWAITQLPSPGGHLDLQCRTDGALPGGVPKPPPSLTVPNRGRWQPRR